jgi:hypothetical protein
VSSSILLRTNTPSSNINHRSRTMKSFPQEPRLKVLNERLSASTTGPNIPRTSPINFICQSITIYGDLSVKFRLPGSSKDANKGTDDSKPLRTTRPQKSICIKSWSKGKTGSGKEFYPDVVTVDKSSPASSSHETTLTTSSGSATPDGIIIADQRPYYNSAGISAKTGGSGV